MGTPRTRPGKYSECSLTPGEYCQQSVVSIELFVNLSNPKYQKLATNTEARKYFEF